MAQNQKTIQNQINTATQELSTVKARLEEQQNILDAYTNLVNHDERSSLIANCIEFGVLVKGKKPTKATAMQAMRTALIEDKSVELGIATLTDQFERLLLALSALRNQQADEQVAPVTEEDVTEEEQMLLSGALPSDLYSPIEVQHEDAVAFVKRQLEERPLLAETLLRANRLSTEHRNEAIAYGQTQGWSNHLAHMDDGQCQQWLTFMDSLVRRDSLTREMMVRERVMRSALTDFYQQKHTANTEKHAVATHAALTDFYQTDGATCFYPGEHPGFGYIPTGFRIRAEGDLYRADRWHNEQWITYINKAGREGFSKSDREAGKWVRRWAQELTAR